MFADESEREDALLQGDICGVDVFPSWVLSETSLLVSGDAPISHVQMPVHKRMVTGPDGPLVMVLSHSCDIENPRARTGIVVAPLIPVPANPQDPSGRFSDITNSWQPTDGAFSYIHLFPVPIQAEPGGWAVVDFSALTTMQRLEAAAKVLRGNRFAQLSDDSRAAMQTKLAVWLAAEVRGQTGSSAGPD